MIRRDEPDDEPVCAEIFSRAWRSSLAALARAISAADFRGLTRRELLFVAQRGTDVVVFVSIRKPTRFIHHLYVDPDAQRTGIGRRLLEHDA
jgi:GNAT superfamily N-acetyltransferase